MIAKLSIICPLLLVAGFVTFSNSSPTDQLVTKTFLELHDEAMQACMVNTTLDMIETTLSRSRVDQYCPIICYIQKLGIVNSGGLNKIAVNFTRDLAHLYYTYLVSLDERYKQNEDRDGPYSQYRYRHNYALSSLYTPASFEAILRLTPKLVDSFNDACSSKNETAVTSIARGLDESITKEKEENLGYFTPSEEASPMLELILNTTLTCSTKFNVSSLEIADNWLFKQEGEDHKKNTCYLHCLLSESNFVNENGLTEPWAEVVRDMFERHDRVQAMPIFNDAAILINAKCSTGYDELPEDYFRSIFDEVDSRYRSERRNALKD